MIRSSYGLPVIWFTTRLTDYYPVTSTLFWLEWRLWGNDPAGYHAVNLALHALSTLVAWRVLRRLAVPGALLAAAIFAVHPVGAEVAAWISETKTTLSFPLFGLALASYLRFEERGTTAWYVTSLTLFLLAVLAKTSVVMLPVVLLLLAWWRRGRIERRDVQGVLPFFAVALLLGLVTVRHQAHHAIGPLDVRPEGLASRVAAAGWCIWFYAFKLLAPLRLSAIYPRWNVDPTWPVAWLPLLGLVAIAFAAWRRRSGWGRPVILAGGYYVLMLGPILGLVPFGFHRYSLVADHLQYPAMIGPVALFAAALSRLRGARRPAAWWPAALVIVLLASLTVLAHERARVFRDRESLWTDTLRKNPTAWVAHYNLGLFLAGSGDLGEAVRHYQRSLEIHPDNASAHDALGQVLRRQGRLDEAIARYRRALEIDPGFAGAHNNLANALSDRGDLEEAIRHYRRALEIDPEHEQARVNLEWALKKAAARKGSR